MTNTSTSNRKHSRMAAVVVILLVVALLFSTQAPGAKADWKIKPDWSRVQTVTPGTRTTVLLFRDLAPPGKREIKGQFHSATPESVTMLLGPGKTRTLEKKDVRRVLVFRPLGKRYQVGVATAVGLTAGIFMGIGLSSADTDNQVRAFTVGLGTVLGLAVGIGYLLAPKMGGIYNVPRNYKNYKKRQGSAPNR